MNDQHNNYEKSGSHERNLGFLMLILFLCAIVPISLKIYKIWQEKKIECNQKLAEEERIKVEVKRLKKTNAKLRQRIKLLKTNQGVEQVAREKLGLIKPNEIPFIVDEGDQLEEDVLPVIIPTSLPVGNDKKEKENQGEKQ